MAPGLAFVAAVAAVLGVGTLRAPRPGSRESAARRVVARVAGALPARLRPPLDLQARIDAAGRPAGLGAAEIMGLKVLAAGAAVPLATLAGAALPGRLGLLASVAIPAAGFITPDFVLARRARERLRVARRDLPGLLDLLAVAIDAGLSPSRALAAVGERSASPLAGEWAAVAGQVEVGVPLAEALRTLTRRLPAPELRTFAAALERAMRHGAPLSDTLAAQAREARATRRRLIEEQAAKASPKIQLVVALLLVPSVLLVVAAALAAALVGGDAGSVIGR